MGKLKEQMQQPKNPRDRFTADNPDGQAMMNVIGNNLDKLKDSRGNTLRSRIERAAPNKRTIASRRRRRSGRRSLMSSGVGGLKDSLG